MTACRCGLAAARRTDKLAETVAAISERGGSAEAMEFDQGDLDAMTEKLGAEAPFDVVLNSAGLARHGPALETTPEDYDAVMNANVRGAYFLAQAVAKGMVGAGGGGSIVTISSQMGHVYPSR